MKASNLQDTEFLNNGYKDDSKTEEQDKHRDKQRDSKNKNEIRKHKKETIRN